MVKFKNWLFENDEMQERLNAFNTYIKALTDLATKYKTTIHPRYIEHEKQTFMTMPIEQVRQEVINMPKFLKEREADFIRQRREKEAEEKKQISRSKSPGGNYDEAEHGYERIVCSRGDPGFDKTGMTAYPMEEIDPKLKGYYGVHVGGGWLGILKRDGYCDDGDAYLYTIHCDEMINDGIRVYQMEDPHIAYKDSATPDSWIIFSKKKVIPAKYIELDQVIPEDEIEESPPPYGME